MDGDGAAVGGLLDADADGELDGAGVALGDDPPVGDSLVSWLEVAAGGAGGGPTCWVIAQATVPPPARSSPAQPAMIQARRRLCPGCSVRMSD